MQLSQFRELKSFCANLASDPCWREVYDNASHDFEVEGVRFIAAGVIDEVMCHELGSDLYILGCFNAPFLASILEIDTDVIEAMQKAEAFEALGKLILSMDKLEELQEDYASADGYGHHFNSYDGSEEETEIGGGTYYVFDNR